MLADVLTTLAPADIPVWEQYRSFLEWALDGLAEFTGSAGLAIIVFTIIIKTLLLPLTIKSTRSSKAMQEVAPKVKELQKKYGKDRARASQETMALYQQYGVNPMAGCLPMLIQIPIFFGLYRAIYNLSNAADGGAWAHGFLWVPDLAQADPWHILPILAGIFQFVQTRMMRPANQPKSDDPQQQVMNVMMNFMPLMVVLFGWTFAAGPVIYWATQSVYSVVQQWFITGWGSLGEWFPWLPELPEHRRLGYQEPRKLDDVVVVGGAAAAPKTGFQGWMQRKMEEAQKNAAERQKQAEQQRKDTGKTPAGDATTEPNGADGETSDPFAAKRREGSTSYKDRVDAAAKHTAKSRQTNGSTSAAPTAQPRKKKSRKR